MICQREGCELEVPPGRRRWCSDACGSRFHHEKEAAQKRAITAQERTAASQRRPAARIRICLGCDRPFRSTGPGNRFCGRCRGGNAEDDVTPTYHMPRDDDGRELLLDE